MRPWFREEDRHMAATPGAPSTERGSLEVTGMDRVRRRLHRPSAEFWMLLPSLVALAALSIYPFFYLIWMSLSTITLIGGISTTFVGLQNWGTLVTDAQGWGRLLTTPEYGGGTLVPAIVLVSRGGLALNGRGPLLH